MIPQSLPLEPVQPLSLCPFLREAYQRTATINRRYTYEQAMSRPALEIALRLHAEAIRRGWK